MGDSEREKRIWAGRPSQVDNLGTYVLAALFFWLVIPLIVAFWRYLSIRAMRYQVTTERFRNLYGVLNKTIDELELYRVRDYRIDRPLFLRLFGLSNLVLETSDRTHPTVTIRAIPDGAKVMRQIRDQVEACRDAKRVRSIDIDN